MARKVKKFNQIILTDRTITGIAEDSNSVCRTDDGLVCFVDGAVPGDVVDVLVKNKKKGSYYGEVHQMIKPSKDRIEAPCKHFGVCGGCKWQHFDYSGQLREKENKVIQNMRRIGKTEPEEYLPIMGCEAPYFYRNKLEFTFSNKRWLTMDEMSPDGDVLRQPGLGLHRPGAFDKIVDIERCLLQPDPSNAIRNFVRDFCINQGWTFFNVRAREGFLRNLIIKTTSTGEVMVVLSFHYKEDESIDKLLNAIMQKFPDITTLLYVINPKANDTILDLPIEVFYGPGYIVEQLGDVKYKLGPKSFFQTNTGQAIRLYDKALEFAALRPDDLVYDLYTGLGSIALYAAKHCGRVVGVENVAPAIDDAKANASWNKIDNVDFVVGNVEDVVDTNFIEQYGIPDVIITDPPRAGMHATAVNTLLQMECPKIVYISCNPATLARDVEMLSAKYRLDKLQAVDMFPQTNHIEAVSLLTLKS
ncbi:MAG TPA: 23S rRNA (uracil(1939)-C(5))-methyltransferase RlmD [Saprospiraceae bacterium]|jgi:23S rRNA (uracil1939-C5)-methyltransferase|nr:23S rRNA (uracil(1939)-C(5))-methyltransferase RlmD [Saprospiraceae bacterium]HRG43970.1 23S rRNA (uracil(1939)-C(5))-methyltransferase RlmD [Saprospiraceae bacterium]